MRVLEGKVAVVIGGTRGIGAAITRRMAADGASVGATYLKRAEDAERLADALRSAGHSALMVQADVGDACALDAAIDRIVAHFGRLDILVSVAGMAIVGPLDSYADDAFDRSFALNVRAPFLAAKKAASLMTEGGRIVTIGSIVADRMPGAGGTLYAASKAALGGMTRGLARDLGGRGSPRTSSSRGRSIPSATPRTGRMRPPIAARSPSPAMARRTKSRVWWPI